MPEWRRLIRSRIGSLRLDPHREAEIVEELAQDLDDRWRDLVARGTDPAAAAAGLIEEHLSTDALALALGAIERPAPRPGPALGESPRDGWLRGLGDDLRFAVRSLRKSPALTVVALLTLTLGIGANATIFSVVNAILVRPLPFPDPDRLVSFWGTAPDKGLPVVAYPDALYAYYRERAKTVEAIAAYSGSGFTLMDKGEAVRVDGAHVTAEFFGLLGATPAKGRLFQPEEATAGRNRVMLLSFGLWQTRFGADPDIVGRSLLLDGRPTTVVGVMPQQFDFPRRSVLWIPIGIDAQSLNCWCYDMIGRLRPGQTEASLVREIDNLNNDFWAEREHRAPVIRKPGEPAGTIAMPLARQLTGEVRTPALVLLGAVAMVLLIACANLANLLLARATARSREIAVRAALGASPARIRRQLLAESGLLSVGGAILGLGLARAAQGPIGRATADRVPHLDGVHLDAMVLCFTVALTVATTVLFGLVPAFRATRVGTAAALRDGARGATDRAGRRLNDGFAVAQMALALILLVGAGLLIRSFAKLVAIDPGFRADHVAVGRLALPWTDYQRPERARAVFHRVLERVGALPGVDAAGFTSTAPFSPGDNQREFLIEGREPGASEPIPVASNRTVTPGYFEVVGTRVVAGRSFSPADRDSAELVAVVDESLARRYWPDGNAVGHRISLDTRAERNWRTIIGVVASTRHQELGRAPDHYVYLPLDQDAGWEMDLVVRGRGSAASMAAAIRAAMPAIEPTHPFYDIHTLAEAIDRSLATRRLLDLLLVGFAGVALLLAAIGVYGVMSRSVAARVREFGVRLALGATPERIRGDVLGQGAKLVAAGAVIGGLGAAAVTGLLGGLLYEVAPFDPIAFSAAVFGLGAVALVACYLPAVRATRSDPVTALRAD